MKQAGKNAICKELLLRRKKEQFKRRTEAGQTLTLVAFGLIVFLLAAGLAVDMGYLRWQKRQMQAAADSAALAAATDQNHGNSAAAQTDALAIAASDGFTNGVNNTTVNAYQNGSVDPTNAMEVDIQEVYPTFFMMIAGFNTSTISAGAVATIGTSGGCMYALGVGGAGITLNAGVQAPNCGIVDNGPLNGSGNINSPSIGVYGANAYGGVPSTPIGQIPQPEDDPLAYLNAPGVGGCTPDPMYNAASGPLGNGVVTVFPQTFCALTINPGADVTFESGLYIISTGNFSITGSAIAQSDAGGVTFYLANSAGSVTFNGTGTVNFVASTGGVGGLPAGLLFYQDPGDTNPADVSGQAGSNNVVLNGTLYFPQAPLTIAGSFGAQNIVSVAQSITVAGTVIMNADSTSVSGGSPLQNISLVE